MGKMKDAAEELAVVEEKPRNSIENLLKSNWKKIEQVMPKHMNSDRLYQIAVSTLSRNPRLAACDIVTILSCVMRCSALGLEPNDVDGLGRAYLIPRKNNKRGIDEATFLLGYTGMIELAMRSEKIKSLAARAVYVDDIFEYELGLEEKLKHIPLTQNKTPDKLTHVYLVAHFTNGGHYIDVMTKDDVEEVRKASSSPNRGPWVDNYEAMARKSVVRRNWRYLPISIDAQKAATMDESTGGYEQVFSSINFTDPPIVEDVMEVEAEVSEPEEAITEQGLANQPVSDHSIAVCENCGYRMDVDSGSDLKEIEYLCCERPSFIWA